MSLGPNQPLIGRPGGRALLATPALILDLDRLERNIATMATFARAAGMALKPHAKTHKSAHVAALQLAAGAVGLTCATLGEAEALAPHVAAPLLITAPVIGTGAIARLHALARRSPGLAVVVDHPANLAGIAQAFTAQPLTVFVDIDPGLHRTGVASLADAVALARAVAASPTLHFGGVQFFSGPSQHIERYEARRSDVAAKTHYLASIVEALRNAGLPPPVVTGGGTGTHALDAEFGVMTELQAGSYVFMDDQYSACGLRPGDTNPFDTALMIDTRVISANWPALATVDAGLKASTGSSQPPTPIAGVPEGTRYEYRGDEYGALLLPPGKPTLPLGAVVTLATPHCDPTVNLHNVYHVVRGDTLIDIWPITARGRSA
ncbi:MAG: DSD1 family PLP-dependent enzyme [Polymorphobacter sp.]|uniref:DSD1 family PLP-dependent enzyme n=1 Tax=Polymorphobacter sp. TaxID=1909290 RepID=UPI003A85F578